MIKKSKNKKIEKVVKISYLEGKNISSTISKNLTEKYLKWVNNYESSFMEAGSIH